MIEDFPELGFELVVDAFFAGLTVSAAAVGFLVPVILFAIGFALLMVYLEGGRDEDE